MNSPTGSETAALNRTSTPGRLLQAMALTAALAACSPQKPAAPANDTASLPKNHQPVAKHTEDSGGPLPPEQAALDVRHADLSFKILPDEQKIEGDAVLTLGIVAPVSIILLDFDPA